MPRPDAGDNAVSSYDSHCLEGGGNVVVRELGEPVRQLRNQQAPAVADGAVFFYGASDTNDGLATQLDLFVHQPGADMPQRLTGPDQSDSLQASGGGRVLTEELRVASSSAPHFYEVLHRVRNRSGEILGEFVDHEFRLAPSRDAIAGEAPYFFDGERVLLLGKEGAIGLFDISGNKLGRLNSTPERTISASPKLTTGGVAFTATETGADKGESNPRDVFVWRPDGEAQRLTDSAADERYISPDGDDLYWVTEDTVYKRPAGAEPRPIHQGRCGPPHAADGLAAFACAKQDTDDGLDRPAVSQLFLHDGADTRQIQLDTEPALIHSVRVSPNGIAWIEFDEATALCDGDTSGQVMYHDFSTRSQLEVGHVLAPCTCCERHTVGLSLTLSDGIVAWNNAQPEPQNADVTTGFAYAVVGDGRGCDR